MAIKSLFSSLLAHLPSLVHLPSLSATLIFILYAWKIKDTKHRKDQIFSPINLQCPDVSGAGPKASLAQAEERRWFSNQVSNVILAKLLLTSVSAVKNTQGQRLLTAHTARQASPRDRAARGMQKGTAPLCSPCCSWCSSKVGMLWLSTSAQTTQFAIKFSVIQRSLSWWHKGHRDGSCPGGRQCCRDTAAPRRQVSRRGTAGVGQKELAHTFTNQDKFDALPKGKESPQWSAEGQCDPAFQFIQLASNKGNLFISCRN